MTGDSTLIEDSDSDIIIKRKHFKGTTGLRELLTLKSVKRKNIMSDDMRSYKKIMEMTDAHLTEYESDGNIFVTRGVKFRDIIAPLFPQTRRQGIESA